MRQLLLRNTLLWNNAKDWKIESTQLRIWKKSREWLSKKNVNESWIKKNKDRSNINPSFKSLRSNLRRGKSICLKCVVELPVIQLEANLFSRKSKRTTINQLFLIYLRSNPESLSIVLASVLINWQGIKNGTRANNQKQQPEEKGMRKLVIHLQ